MVKPFEQNGLYEFEDYRLDCKERTLWRGDELIPLPSKVFDTLCVLVEKQGKVVSKSEIMETVWQDSFVEEGNLTQNIYTLRRVLGVDKNGKQFIETLSRKGYRFASDVRLISPSTENVDNHQIENEFAEETHPVFVTKAKTPFSISRYIIPLALSAFVALIILGITGGVYYSRTNKKENLSSSIEKMDFRKLTFSGDVVYPVISPTEDAFAYISNNSIFIQQNDSEQATKLDIPSEKSFSFLQFSRDGKSISYRDQKRFLLSGDVYQMPLFSGTPKQIAQNVWSGFSFSPNGSEMVFVRILPGTETQNLIVKNLITDEERVLAVIEAPLRFIQAGSPSWSPDGSKIAVPISKQAIQVGSSYMVVFDVESGKMEEINTPQIRQIEQVVWLPEGDSLAMVARENKKFFQLWEVSYPQGKLRKITNDGNIYRTLSISTDGKRLLTSQFSTFSHIWTIDRLNEENTKQITKGNLNRDGVVGFALTASDNVIYTSRTSGNMDLWQVSLIDESRKQLTKNTGDQNSNPSVSQDGRYIYFNSIRSGTKQIWRMDAETGENQTQITFGEDTNALFPQVSPDGNFLYYIKKKAKEKTVIQRKSLIDGKEESLPIDENISPDIFLALSPDGKLLATCNLTEDSSEEDDERKSFHIAVISTSEKSKPQIFLTTDSHIVWNQDSRSFDYAENSNEGSKLWRKNLLTDDNPELILNVDDGRIANFAWTKDKKNLVLAKRKLIIDAMLLTDFR